MSPSLNPHSQTSDFNTFTPLVFQSDERKLLKKCPVISGQFTGQFKVISGQFTGQFNLTTVLYVQLLYRNKNHKEAVTLEAYKLLQLKQVNQI